MAYGSNVNYIINLSMAFNGSSMYVYGSIRIPIIPDSSGILNLLLYKGSFVCSILPWYNIPWRTVGDMKG